MFEAYESPELAKVDPELVLDPEHRVTPIDRGDVCLNYDKAWFAEHDLAPPRTLDDLTLPRYAGLLVVENPATSTPGPRVHARDDRAVRRDGWQGYWRKLRANGVARRRRLGGGVLRALLRRCGQQGQAADRRLVRVEPAGRGDLRATRSPTTRRPASSRHSCFRQIEFAGVLRGARNEDGARKLVDFMLSKRFQEDIPLQMFVFPARSDAALPPEFEQFAVVPKHPLELPPAEIEANRERWIDEWTDIVVR